MTLRAGYRPVLRPTLETSPPGQRHHERPVRRHRTCPETLLATANQVIEQQIGHIDSRTARFQGSCPRELYFRCAATHSRSRLGVNCVDLTVAAQSPVLLRSLPKRRDERRRGAPEVDRLITLQIRATMRFPYIFSASPGRGYRFSIATAQQLSDLWAGFRPSRHNHPDS
jgi:hypothetical protein